MSKQKKNCDNCGKTIKKGQLCKQCEKEEREDSRIQNLFKK